MTTLEQGALEGAAVSAPQHGIGDADFARAVLAGLAQPQKELPCRFFYDGAGSLLFEEITRLDEYYPTRTEAAILRDCAQDISERTAPGSVLVEFGSGSSTKTEILLAAMSGLAGYVAIDVSADALADAAARMAGRFPGLNIETLIADFNGPVQLPALCDGASRLGFFPGSTVGNLTRPEAKVLLQRFAGILGRDARLVVGVDLRKDLAVLLPAYNDSAGVTAAFNLNLLVRINRELAGTFDLRRFRHEAIWNESEGRIEMHLVSETPQTVQVCGRTFNFAAGETIHTENSHKYGVEEFGALAQASGWRAERCWKDAGPLFSVHELRRAD